jgi:hypothetical protein
MLCDRSRWLVVELMADFLRWRKEMILTQWIMGVTPEIVSQPSRRPKAHRAPGSLREPDAGA